MKDKFVTFFQSKTSLIVLSIILGIGAWLAVLGSTNPIIDRTLEVPITFENEDVPATLDLKDMTVTFPKTASVTVSGRKETLNNLNASEITVKCDMQTITVPGETVIKVPKPECERIGVSVSDYYPKNIMFNYDKTETKNLDVRVVYDNKLLEDGFEYVSVTPSLSSIPVTGMKSLIDTCEYIRIDLSDSIEEGTLDSNKNAAFLGKFISYAGENITHKFAEEKVAVEIQVGKRVNLYSEYTGEPASGYYFDGLELSVPYKIVQGDTETLRKLEAIDLGVVDITGATENVVKTIQLSELLPAGVVLVGDPAVTVTALVGTYETRTYTIFRTSLTIPGLNDAEYDYDISPDRYTVSVKGRREDMEEFMFASAVPTLNLENRTVGEYNIPLTFGALDTSKYTIVGEYVFTVKITRKIVETPTPAPTSTPTPVPTSTPTPVPTQTPTPVPTEVPTPSPATEAPEPTPDETPDPAASAEP